MNANTSLIATQLNNKMLDILCQSLVKTNGDLIENKIEITSNDYQIITNLEHFDTRIIINYSSKLDPFNRIIFNLKILTYNSKQIASLEMIFNPENLYEEGSFSTQNEYLITESLLKELDQNRTKIIQNIF